MDLNLGEIPIDPTIADCADSGAPAVASKPEAIRIYGLHRSCRENRSRAKYCEFKRRGYFKTVQSRVAIMEQNIQVKKIWQQDERTLGIQWSDDEKSLIRRRYAKKKMSLCILCR